MGVRRHSETTMNDELLKALSKAAMTQLALENLRAKDTARALELLELDLDASVISLARLANEAAPAERERLTDALRQIRAYRHAYPRRTEADRKSTRLNSSHLGISYAVFCF